MKPLLTISIVLIFGLSGCDIPGVGYDVEQEIRFNKYSLKDELRTWVWKDNRLLYDWADPVEDMTDSLIKLRQRQADSLIAKVKSFR